MLFIACTEILLILHPMLFISLLLFYFYLIFGLLIPYLIIMATNMCVIGFQ